jgi:hypothetical protein
MALSIRVPAATAGFIIETQSRGVHATATVNDAWIGYDIDEHSGAAPDAGPYTQTVSAGTYSDYTSGSASASQSSTLYPAVSASGAASAGSYSSPNYGGIGSGSSGSSLRIVFVVDEPTTFSLSGTVTAAASVYGTSTASMKLADEANTTTFATKFAGASGDFLWSEPFAFLPQLDAGSYVLTISSSASESRQRAHTPTFNSTHGNYVVDFHVIPEPSTLWVATLALACGSTLSRPGRRRLNERPLL